jgi:hypothetical protein
MVQPPTKACGKRAGLCVIEVCSSLFIFITWDRTKVFICPPATSQTLAAIIMTGQPRHNITPERATDLLKDGQPLNDCYVDGQVKIETSETWDKEVVIENCIIEYFSGSVTQFLKPVRFMNSHFKKCQFVFTYFPGGLTIDNCTCLVLK